MSRLEPPLKDYPKEWFLERINSGHGGITSLSRDLNVSTSAIWKKLRKLNLTSMQNSKSWPILKELNKLRRKPEKWTPDGKTIIDSRAGLSSLYKMTTPGVLSSVAMISIIHKLQPVSVLEPYAQSGSVMMGTLAAKTHYSGVARDPKTYADLQKLVEMVGTIKADINYVKLPQGNKHELIIVAIPDPPIMIKKHCRQIIKDLEKVCQAALAPTGHLGVILPEWWGNKLIPLNLTETESIRIRSAYDENGTKEKVVRVFAK